ncbi:type IV pilin protein [Agrococcus citreus]|uniref:Prepilin-type N-terminal cleavage/methylation domain-containing protein n=1 Tax=Agrococcus citreus TaxID=84643 RepID=A0ABP4JRF3_9MICO
MQNLLRALGDRRIALKDGKQSQKGFTLVELLVVVIIIGILAGIAIPVFLNQRESAWRAEMESDLKNAALAAETFAVDNDGSYTGLTVAKLVSDYGLRLSHDVATDTDYVVLGTPAPGQNFVLKGTHPDLSGDTLEYNSASGGLQTWQDAPAAPVNP